MLPASLNVPGLIDWYREHARDLPWRREAFRREYGAWGILVSEFMLQQTPVARVIPHLEAWLTRWPTPVRQAEASPAEVVSQWSNLGYPRRALWLHRAAVLITQEHRGQLPADVDALRALPGIGDYTARAVTVFAYGQRHPVVDTNTRRVIARAVHGLSQPGSPARRDLNDMAALLPDDDEEAAVVNAAMMELGACTCTSRRAFCEHCPLQSTCRWHELGHPDTGDRRPRQARYEGSDRQARGAVLKVLRESSGHQAPPQKILADWPDPAQRDRAIGSLIADGLIEARDGLLALPE